jgi:hypothetical protein
MALTFLLAFALIAPAAAAPVQSRSQDGVAALVARLEAASAAIDRDAILALGTPGAKSGLEELASALTWPPASRTIIKERDRIPEPDGSITTLVEVFAERGIEGRVGTWDLRLVPPAPGTERWRIGAVKRLSLITGLFKLSLDSARQYDVRGLTLRAPDLTLQLPSGSLFVAATPSGPTAIVLLGRGRLRFAPPDRAERTQIRIFAGADALEGDFDAAFIRVRPAEFESRFQVESMTPRAAVSPRDLRRAGDVFDEFVGRTLRVDLGDLSRERWSLTPPPGNIIAEIRTRRFGSLTYARSTHESEDVLLFERRRRRNIAVYASADKLAERGRFYSDDDLVDYDVLDYDIDVDFDPNRLWLEGKARVRIRIRAAALQTLTLKLAETLVVRSIFSPELGPLLNLRVVGQNSLIVNLPVTAVAGAEFWLNVTYGGRLEPQEIDREALQVQQQEDPFLALEPRFIFSNRSYWHPQSTVTDYSTATLRITVPADYDVVASGDPREPAPPPGVVQPGQRERKAFAFVSREPLRYLSFVVSRFNPVDSVEASVPRLPSPGVEAARTLQHVTLPSDVTSERATGGPVSPAADPGTVKLYVQANPRQVGRARGMTDRMAAVFAFYASLVGDAPYASFTLALSESALPGGHSPAYFAMLNQAGPAMAVTWHNDPVAFDSYPTFFLAHEMAHQWWGQAVGWKNYHEQWISEGFAQYFAALYAEKERGRDVFVDLLEQMRATAVQASPQGPVHLGYRLGHIRGDSRVYRSLVYNKGAMVLHMLRRLVGDEAFFAGLRGFYRDWRFRKAGTDDFRKAMEQASNRELSRFFDAWIYGDSIPRLHVSHRQQTGGTIVLRLEHRDDVVVVPITVTLNYVSGASEDVIVTVDEKHVERTVPLKGALRSVVANADHAALARIDR